MSWQVQEAKQRFSEMLRAAEKDGPQTITRHGEVIAVMVDIDEYRKLKAHSNRKFAEHLLAAPRLSDDEADIFDEVERERKLSLPREVDFGDDE